MGIFSSLKILALSFTVSGNSGISPFLTLLTLLAVNRVNPYFLNMKDYLQPVAEHWLTLLTMTGLTFIELIAKCIPCIDELVDSIVLFIIPFVSVASTLCTFGMYSESNESTENISNYEREYYYNNIDDNVQNFYNENRYQNLRYRQLTVDFNVSALVIIQIISIILGIGLSICLHLFKMVVRLMGEGCLTCSITILEYIFVIFTLITTIWMHEVALFVGTGFIIISILTLSRRYKKNVAKTNHNIEMLNNYERFRDRQDRKIQEQSDELNKIQNLKI